MGEHGVVHGGGQQGRPGPGEQQRRQQVDQAYAVAEALYTQAVDSGQPERAPQLITEALRNVRFFGGRGYLFIDDMDGNCVLLPTSPQLEGQSLLDNRDDSGHSYNFV